MDWLEGKVAKLISKLKNSNMYTSLLYTMLLALLAAVILFVITRNICESWIRVIMGRYSAFENLQYSLLSIRITDVPGHVQISLIVLEFLCDYSIVLFLMITEYIGVRLFFKRKVEPGFAAIHNAVEYLNLGDLGHEKSYFNENELGKISNDIENLRKKLIEQKRQEWKLQEEQVSINAAFAHDMRTPLTVMKGYTEFLLKYVPEDKVSKESLLEKLEIMYGQQDRLLNFSKTMSQIQTMEMRELNCGQIEIEEFYGKLKGTIKELETQSGKILHFIPEVEKTKNNNEIMADEDLIMEVCENLISNALRYAKKEVEIEALLQNNMLVVYVADDGNGFSTKALQEAKKLYWSEEKGNGNHFGMGLYMCDKLCHKHGGKLNLTNGIAGGAIAAAEFKIGN